MPHLYPMIVALLALIFYFVLTLIVAATRGKAKIDPTSGLGDAAFQRLCRVQVNTCEQLVLFLPALYLCATTFSPNIAAGLGGLWLIGRMLYWRGYATDFSRRAPGFILTMLATAFLLVGSGIGLGRIFLG